MLTFRSTPSIAHVEQIQLDMDVGQIAELGIDIANVSSLIKETSSGRIGGLGIDPINVHPSYTPFGANYAEYKYR